MDKERLTIKDCQATHHFDDHTVEKESKWQLYLTKDFLIKQLHPYSSQYGSKHCLDNVLYCRGLNPVAQSVKMSIATHCHSVPRSSLTVRRTCRLYRDENHHFICGGMEVRLHHRRVTIFRQRRRSSRELHTTIVQTEGLRVHHHSV